MNLSKNYQPIYPLFLVAKLLYKRQYFSSKLILDQQLNLEQLQGTMLIIVYISLLLKLYMHDLIAKRDYFNHSALKIPPHFVMAEKVISRANSFRFL